MNIEIPINAAVYPLPHPQVVSLIKPNVNFYTVSALVTHLGFLIYRLFLLWKLVSLPNLQNI